MSIFVFAEPSFAPGLPPWCSLSEPLGETRWELVVRPAVPLRSASVVFTVPRDLHDPIGLTVIAEGKKICLGRRQPFFPLLLLARAWRQSPDGWIRIEELERQAGMTRKV